MRQLHPHRIDGCLTLKLCDNAFSHQLFPKEYEEPGLLSRHIMSQRRNEGPRPVRWMAVEQLQGAPNSKQTDMVSDNGCSCNWFERGFD